MHPPVAQSILRDVNSMQMVTIHTAFLSQEIISIQKK